MPPPLGRKELRWAQGRRGAAARAEIEPDVVIERYYNFGGEGIAAAAETGALAVLEVNAPVIDSPGSRKRLSIAAARRADAALARTDVRAGGHHRHA